MTGTSHQLAIAPITAAITLDLEEAVIITAMTVGVVAQLLTSVTMAGELNILDTVAHWKHMASGFCFYFYFKCLIASCGLKKKNFFVLLNF